MGYVKDNLMNNEEIIHMAKVNWFIYMPGLILLLLSFGSLALALNINEKEYEGISMISIFMFLVFFIAALVSLLKAFIYKISTELAVTTKRVIAKTGLIKRETLELNHSKVESFNIDQSILGRIFNFGSIIVRGTGGGKTPIPNIDDPMTFRKEAMQIIDKVENN